MGFRFTVFPTTIAKANEWGDWRIWAAIAQELIRTARALYSQEDFGGERTQTAYAFDNNHRSLS